MNTSLSRPTPAPSTARRQRGSSLVELMVGLTIGLLVAVAALGSLVYARLASNTVDDGTRLNQEAMTAWRIIGGQLRQAGARRLDSVPDCIGAGCVTTKVAFNTDYPATLPPLFGYAGQLVSGSEGASGAPDTIAVFLGLDLDPALAVDCLGEPSAVTTGITSTFSVSDNALRCRGAGASSAAGAQALVAGVEDLQVWYGQRAGNDLRYLSANNVSNWPAVDTVMICLRIVGELRGYSTAGSIGCNGEDIASDGRLRRVFWHAYRLRNVGL